MADPINQPIHVDTKYDYRLMLADGRPVLGVVGGGHAQPFTPQEIRQIAAHAVQCWNAGQKAIAAKTDACNWAQADFETDAWETTCGGVFRLDDGTPSDNQMRWCCYCGKSLQESPWADPDSESES